MINTKKATLKFLLFLQVTEEQLKGLIDIDMLSVVN